MDIEEIKNGLVALMIFIILFGAVYFLHVQNTDIPPSYPSPSIFNITSSSDPIIGIWKIADFSLFNGKLIMFTPDGQFFAVEQKQDGTSHPVQGPAGTWKPDNVQYNKYYLYQMEVGYRAYMENGNKLSIPYVDDNYNDISSHTMEKQMSLVNFSIS